MASVFAAPLESWSAEAVTIDARIWAKEDARRAAMTAEERAAEDAATAVTVAAIRASLAAAPVTEVVQTRVWLEEATDGADGLWSMPWARDLELKYGNIYDCRGMCEKDYASFMRWLCARGFDVYAYGHRAIVSARDAGLPPMEWVSTKPAVSTKYVPRFCVRCDVAAPAADCFYEHGDTIARVDEPCKFGDACTGPKRAACLRMHPGETWTASSVIRRCCTTATCNTSH